MVMPPPVVTGQDRDRIRGRPGLSRCTTGLMAVRRHDDRWGVPRGGCVDALSFEADQREVLAAVPVRERPARASGIDGQGASPATVRLIRPVRVRPRPGRVVGGGSGGGAWGGPGGAAPGLRPPGAPSPSRR